MIEEPIIFQEQCGVKGQTYFYCREGPNEIVRHNSTSRFSNAVASICDFCKQIVLPHGYPDSVSEDYLNYQIWDTVQAFCSTITSAFTTRAILKGMGVGDSQASALSATIAWILKDGAGMIGRILFAWWKGCDLDNDCKKWRFAADIINDIAMLIELFLPFISYYSLQVLCVTSMLKSIVGVAGGATRASITHHQAIKENMAEISAIDGTQETIVNLFASFASIFLLNVVTNRKSEFCLIIFLMAIHLFSNYKAVKSLIFRKFNRQRLVLLLKSYYNVNLILNTSIINQKETVLLGTGIKDGDICGFKIIMGKSLKKVGNIYSAEELSHLLSIFENKNYAVVPDVDTAVIYVIFENCDDAREIVEAYFYATFLSIAICYYFDYDLSVNSKRYLHQHTPVSRLGTYMRKYHREDRSNKIPIVFYSSFLEFVNKEISMFFTLLSIHDWDVTSHSLNVGDWRVQWKQYVKKNL